MSSPTVAALEARFNSFSIIAVIFCSLSALFGVYLVLFILAMWSTYRRSNGNDVRLRVVTMVFMTLLIHYVSRAVQFGRSRIMTPPASEQAHVTVPLLFITTLTTTVASFVSDGLLAWRFYVIFERRTWTLYVPATALTINALLGFSGNCLYLSFYNNPARYSYMQNISFKISVAWGWSIFAINTLLTIAIMAKILLAARRSTGLLSRMHGIQYSVIIEALSESAFVTWFGLALFEISSLAPTEGHITNAMNFGYVMRCIIPIFFVSILFTSL
ncbi:hypothetical protein BDW22DRAFT_1429352 [Trametopsis cervina]|nr:hypothetical protein BDW22DRAFT_1429352 [Trametopsis cervina]